jgi:TPR repeat protein
MRSNWQLRETGSPGQVSPLATQNVPTGRLSVAIRYAARKTALKLYRKPDAGNYSTARYCIGLIYANGQDVAQDYGEARLWYLKAGDQNDLESEAALGNLYANGEDVQQNLDKAADWYLKAGDILGDNEACYWLAMCYLEGKGGLKQDAALAVKWLTKAASNEDPIAQYQLGLLYEAGKGVEKSAIRP